MTPQQRWRRALASFGWPGVVGAVAAMCLLLAFGQVVSQSVRTNESRWRAGAAHADATWRCQAERDRRVRLDCLAQLEAAAAAPGR